MQAKTQQSKSTVMIHSAPPWAPSGYGLQCRYLAEILVKNGYKVYISAFGGVHENTLWTSPTGIEIPIMSTGGRTYGNGVLAGNYHRAKADLLITLGDLWMMDPQQFAGLNVMPWCPLDCSPLGVMDKQWLDHVSKICNLHLVAMSKFGQEQLREAGYDSVVLAHGTEFTPKIGDGVRWRMNRQVPEKLFLIGKVGVNNEDDRKAFVTTMLAFTEFARKHNDVGLYLHTEAQAKKSPNLAYMAMQLGLVNDSRTKVIFCDEYLRATDSYDQNYMSGVYNGIDVLDMTSKGEGFGCCTIDALACGTPVIGARNSATTEKISSGYGWLIGGQPEWTTHHNSWWQTPSVSELVRAYEKAYTSARSIVIKKQAADAGKKYSLAEMEKAVLGVIRPLLSD